MTEARNQNDHAGLLHASVCTAQRLIAD